MDETPSPLPGGRVVHCPYILIVAEFYKDKAIFLAINQQGSCSAVFIHNVPAIGEWTVTEGLSIDRIRQDKNLTLVWTTADP